MTDCHETPSRTVIVETGPQSLLGHPKDEIEDVCFSHHILMLQMFRTLVLSKYLPSIGEIESNLNSFIWQR